MTGVEVSKTSTFGLLLLLIVLQDAPVSTPGAPPVSEGSNPRDWQKFKPQNFRPAHRLVPSFSLSPKKCAQYSHVPYFVSDPSRQSVVYGRGRKSLPTVVYAKAYDVLRFGNKFFGYNVPKD